MSPVAIIGTLPSCTPLFAIAGSVINFVACVSYVSTILKGEATPNRVTWFLWALVPLIAGAAQLRTGVGISTLVVLSVGRGPAGVVLASFTPKTVSWKLGHSIMPAAHAIRRAEMPAEGSEA